MVEPVLTQMPLVAVAVLMLLVIMVVLVGLVLVALEPPQVLLAHL